MNAQQKEQRALALEAQLLSFHQNTMPLHGAAPPENMLAFIWQLIDSLQRVSYVQTVRGRPISAARADPRSPYFDPIRAAVALSKAQAEEAFWLVFLATHCGRNLRTEWRLVAELYGAWGEKSLYGKKYFGIVRSTFLVDANGTVAKVWPKVKVEGHAEEVLAAVKAL